jgi:uncharacterized protein YheU (UPF0270 family)
MNEKATSPPGCTIALPGLLADTLEQIVEAAAAREGQSRRDVELEVLRSGIAEMQRKLGLSWD